VCGESSVDVSSSCHIMSCLVFDFGVQVEWKPTNLETWEFARPDMRGTAGEV